MASVDDVGDGDLTRKKRQQEKKVCCSNSSASMKQEFEKLTLEEQEEVNKRKAKLIALVDTALALFPKTGKAKRLMFDDEFFSCRKLFRKTGEEKKKEMEEEEEEEREMEKAIKWTAELPCSRRFTPAERKLYDEQVRKTGGFDVCVPPDVSDYGLIFPRPNFDKNPWMLKRVLRSAREAIDFYNNKNGEHFHFIRVVKLNSMAVSGYNHYITFEAAKDKDAAPMCFQALVYAGIPEDVIEVQFCRPQPKS